MRKILYLFIILVIFNAVLENETSSYEKFFAPRESIQRIYIDQNKTRANGDTAYSTDVRQR